MSAHSDLLYRADVAEPRDELSLVAEPSHTLLKPLEELVKVHDLVGVWVSGVEDEVGPA